MISGRLYNLDLVMYDISGRLYNLDLVMYDISGCLYNLDLVMYDIWTLYNLDPSTYGTRD